MGKVSRRSFIKVAAGAGIAGGIGGAVQTLALEPFLRPPEEELPGRATWYATTCMQCPAGCGVIVRVINGRPRKIEGNPAHPLNRGKLCARGQAGLQVLYDPDRLRNAVQQVGGRGSHRFEPIPWTDAIERLASSIGSLADPSRIAILCGMVPDHLYAILSRFTDSLSAPPPTVFDLHTALDGRFLATELADRWFGVPRLPVYDIARAEAIFSFGANFLETWMSPVSQSFDYGIMRQGQLGGRGYLVQFEPRLSATGASADEWVPVKPGTEGLVALALGRIIVEENLGSVGSQRENAGLYRDVNVSQIAEASGITLEEFQRLARIFAGVDRSIAIPGGQPAGHSNGVEALDAILALNVVMRRIGREGGVFLPAEMPTESFTEPVSPVSFEALEQLIDRMSEGAVDLLLIHGTNPVYDLPDWARFVDALKKVPLVISFSSIVDETALWSDLVLPDHTYLEGWGFKVAEPGADRPTVSSQQPVVRPLYDTRSTADVILEVGKRLGGTFAEALPWEDEAAYLENVSSQLLGSSVGIYDAQTPEGYWSRWRQFGGWWSENPIRREPDLKRSLSDPLVVEDAKFAGDQDKYPFHLVPFESITLGDGRGANQPWLQETPDPMTTARWNTWVEINPQTAAALGVGDNDLVRVTSLYGEIEAPVVVYPGIHPGVVAIPTGQGHTEAGRFASGRGANVMDLMIPFRGLDAKHFIWGGTRVKVEPVGQKKEIAMLEDLDGAGRESIR